MILSVNKSSPEWHHPYVFDRNVILLSQIKRIFVIKKELLHWLQ